MHSSPYDNCLASLSRRQLLNVAWKLGVGVAVAPLCSRHALATPVFTHYPFSLGVASGDPRPDGVVLWTRLAPEPLEGGGMPMKAVDVHWQIASDEQMRTLVQQGTTLAHPVLGHSVHVEVDGLQPGRHYWYRFTAGGERSPVGRTRTAPAHGSRIDTLRFGVCGCNHYEQGLFTAYRYMADEHFDAIFHTGDYIYEYRPDGGPRHRVRQHLGDETFTLTDYRNRYAQYKLDSDLQAAHASAPFIVTWDDHEIDNDWAADHDESNTPPELFRLRRAAAFQAYYESMPLRRSAFPTPMHLQLYRQIRFGDLLSVNALDTRQYRSAQVCRRGTSPSCAQVADPARTMLGERQESWLNERLHTSGTHWNVIAQQVPIFGNEVVEGGDHNAHAMEQRTRHGQVARLSSSP